MSPMRVCLVLIFIMLLSGFTAAIAAETVVYGGQPAAEAGIILSGWGSGSAEDSADKTLSGSKSVKVVTEGWFEGGSIEFKTPAKVFAGKPADDAYLQFTIAPTMQSVLSTSSSDGDWFSKASGQSGSSYDFGAESVQRPKIEKLRLVLTSDKGKRMEFIEPMTPASEAGWVNASIPLKKLAAADAAEYSLKKALVFSDVADTIYIGYIHVVQDKDLITADPEEDMSYSSNEPVPFRANAVGGLGALRRSWDFDNKDGIQEDAIGEFVTHVYKVTGDYIVTLTVTDINGVKASVTKTINVHIE
ncbi:MAG: PKD domain-containing protein [Armatimonadota bacterium]|nr:PKD domain-containing protein [Armatimonadota bacterium]